jgi:hypothetical protein
MNVMSLKVYISGPIAGYPNRNEEAFRAAAMRVRRRGHAPVVPLDIPPWVHDGPCPRGYTGGEPGHSSCCFLRADLAVLGQCDAILMLEKWEWSQGGTLEHRFAIMTGVPVYYFVGALPDPTVLAEYRIYRATNNPTDLLSAALAANR